MRVAAVIPVKALTEAKSRLASVLSAAERAELALWMLERVLRSVAASEAVSDALVVTPDRRVLKWVGQVASGEWTGRRPGLGKGEWSPADTHGDDSTPDMFSIVPVLQQRGDLNAALDLGRRVALARRACGLIVLPGDLPLLEPSEVQEIVRVGVQEYRRMAEVSRQGDPRETGVAVVAPDRLGTGTNALFVAPPIAMPFAFGTDSRARHEALAREREMRVIVYHSEGVAFDVDRPADLGRLDWRSLRWPGDDEPPLSAGGRADERSAG